MTPKRHALATAYDERAATAEREDSAPASGDPHFLSVESAERTVGAWLMDLDEE
ncbi:hypothetical protein [Pyrinomonas sp.]|uniref:hypothetical protein n=1 Tax=Pyrinomonas sp. TaxID=2080306 RepID=UPI003321616C